MATAVIACANQDLAAQVQYQLDESPEVTVVGLAETTAELVDLVVQHEPTLIVVHSELGPEPAAAVVRELGLRRPGTVALMLAEPDPAVFEAALSSGARAVLTVPLQFADVQAKVNGALEWAARMRDAMSGGTTANAGRGGVTVAVAGAKGGVGTSTIAVHLALAARRRDPQRSVLLVDLDLESGDLAGLVDAKARTSVADLAKVANDLSSRAVADSVVSHELGIDLLLPPDNLPDVEFVTPSAIRRVLGLLRQQYDLVVLDVGSRPTPVQVAVVEMADEVVQVVTPDMLSLRALRRTTGWWEALNARKPDATQVLVNRASRQRQVQLDTVRRLSPCPVLDAVIPEVARSLENATNLRDPSAIDGATWRGLMDTILVQSGAAGRAPAATEPARRETRARSALRRVTADDSGQSTLEFVGALPVLVVLIALLFQMLMFAMSFVWANQAAGAAAEQLRTGHSASVAQAAASAAVPAPWNASVTTTVDPSPVTQPEMHLGIAVPSLFGALGWSDWRIHVDRGVVMEP